MYTYKYLPNENINSFSTLSVTFLFQGSDIDLRNRKGKTAEPV